MTGVKSYMMFSSKEQENLDLLCRVFNAKKIVLEENGNIKSPNYSFDDNDLWEVIKKVSEMIKNRNVVGG